MKKLDRAFAGMGRRRLARPRSLALLLGVLGAALVWSGPALALSQRGHVFSFAFGKTTPAEGGSLLHPAAVAVNESSGDVYVVDAGNNRVERFNAKGEFQEAWGWGVSNGEAKYQQCVKTGCKPGLAGTEPAQFSEPDAIAVDNSSGSPSKGDVYVASQENVVEKFSSTGTSLGRLNTATSSVGGVAVDATGVVWVYDSSSANVSSFSSAQPNVEVSSVSLLFECAQPGFAVDATGQTFYANHQRTVFEKEGNALCPETPPSPKTPAVMAKLNGEGEPLTEALDGENTTAAAVDLASGEGSPLGKAAKGDVYVDNITNIAAFDSSGALIQRFGSEAVPALKKGSGVAVNSKTGEVYVADEGTSKVDVFAPAGPGAPEVNSVSAQNLTPTETELKAQIDPRGLTTEYFFQYGTENCATNESACTNTPANTIAAGYGDQPASAVVTNLQSGTTYFYRVIARNEKGQAIGESTVHTFTTLPNPAGLLADQRAWELVSPPEKDGGSIYPLGAAVSGLIGGLVQASEDGSSITYAATAPVEHEPGGNRAPEGIQVLSNRSPQAWSSRGIITPHTKGEGVQSGEPQEYRFFSQDLSLGLVEPLVDAFSNPMQEPPLVAGVASEERGLYLRHNATPCNTTPAPCYEALVTPENNAGVEEGAKSKFGGKLDFVSATPDLSHAIFKSGVSLTEFQASEARGDLYEWGAGQLQLVSVLPGAKPKAAPGDPQLGNDVAGVNGNDRHAISGCISASNGCDPTKNNGSRVFWTEKEPKTHLYMRDTVKGVTIQVNATEEGVKEPKGAEAEAIDEAHFQIASADGSRVFFTDTLRLTKASQLKPAHEGPADLYACELPVEDAEVTESTKCKLTDLTVDPNSNLGENADVVGTVPGASEDGTSIYFVANGALAPGAVHGHCPRATTAEVPPPEATCNLYLAHFNGTQWEAPKLIAVLSIEDEPDWARSAGNQLYSLTARVSPNGRYLAFMSNRPLTGYNNVDANPAAKGARDEEVFLYDQLAEKLTCPSCNPDPNHRPTGVLDTEVAGEGLGLIVDPGSKVWAPESKVTGGRWLAGSIPGWTPLATTKNPNQSRYLLDNGRLFFNSADALVQQDVNHRQEVVGGESVQVGVEDVYQYEPQEVGSCQTAGGCVSLLSSGTSEHESAFLDASASGNDAFFLTSQALVPGDIDTNYDVYDARACVQGSETQCIPPAPPKPAPCNGEESCRPPAPSPPGFGASGTSIFSGPGNTPNGETLHVKVTQPPKKAVNKLANALRVCRKKYKHAKKKRAACERQARKRYGAKKAVHHKGGKK